MQKAEGGQREVMLPEGVVASMMRERPLLRDLIVAGAGYCAKATGQVSDESRRTNQAVFIYCVGGGGWAELAGRLYAVRAGDFLALPPGAARTFGAHASSPWTIHWVRAAGAAVGEYLEALRVSAQQPLLHLGEHLQAVRLFNELVAALEQGGSFTHVLHASHTLAHLLALVIEYRQERQRERSDSVQKVANSIIYMSEHLNEPLRVSGLAALANLSPAHFAMRFKEQTGCAPRDYLHLLRIHRACQLLRASHLSVKEVAARLGYQDQFHFSRQFKAFQGVSPSEYRKASV